MSPQPQRRAASKLAGSGAGFVGGPADRPTDEAATTNHEDSTPQGEAPARTTETADRPQPPRTRNRRRKTTAGPANDDDMVSFNCKMSRQRRRQVRRYAADHDVDIQDVVDAALDEYLDRRGSA